MSVIHRKILIVSGLAVVAVLLVLAVASRQNLGWEVKPPALLAGPLRLTTENPAAIDNLLLGLRVYHYRARPREQQIVREFDYDTADWRLHNQGVSLRLRIEMKRSGKPEYTAKLVVAHPRGHESARPVDLLRGNPATFDEQLASNSWNSRLVEKFGFDPEPFEKTLQEFGVAIDELALQLEGNLVRDRYDVTDKGQTWFEIDHERWTFRRPSTQSGSGAFEIHDLVIELRKHLDAPDLARRAMTMEEFALSMYPLEATQLSPRERAIVALREP